MMTMVMTMTLKMTRMVMMTRTRHDDDDNDDINLLILQLVHFVVNGMTAEVQCLASENLDCLRTLLVSTEYCLVEWYWPLEICRVDCTYHIRPEYFDEMATSESWYWCSGAIYIYLKKFRYILYWAEPDALHLVDYCPSVSKYSKVGWLGHLMHQIVPEMTYNVSSGTLNPTVLSADHSDIIILCSGTWFVQFLFIGGKCMQTLNWEDKNIWRLQFKCGLKKRLCSMHTGICL